MLPVQNDMELGDIQSMQPALYHRYNVVEEGDEDEEDDDSGYKGTSMFEGAPEGVDKMGGGGDANADLTEALNSMHLRDRELGDSTPMEEADLSGAGTHANRLGAQGPRVMPTGHRRGLGQTEKQNASSRFCFCHCHHNTSASFRLLLPDAMALTCCAVDAAAATAVTQICRRRRARRAH